jgi:MFS family permease
MRSSSACVDRAAAKIRIAVRRAPALRQHSAALFLLGASRWPHQRSIGACALDAHDPSLLAVHVPFGWSRTSGSWPCQVFVAWARREQPVGAAYLAEELSESQRKLGAGVMHTGYYFGFFFASVANYIIGANYGWRWMFVFGGFPALLIGFIRYGVRESTRGRRASDKTRARPAMRCVCDDLSPTYLRRTIAASGLFSPDHRTWAGSIYVPRPRRTAVRGAGAAEAARASTAGWCRVGNDRLLCGGALHRRTSGRRKRWPLLRLMGSTSHHRVRLRVLSGGVGSRCSTAHLPLGLGGANFALHMCMEHSTDCRASDRVHQLGRLPVGVAMVFSSAPAFSPMAAWASLGGTAVSPG